MLQTKHFDGRVYKKKSHGEPENQKNKNWKSG